jgi:hypothetical protein
VVLSLQTGVRLPVPLGFSIGSYSLAADVFFIPMIFSPSIDRGPKKIGRLAAPDSYRTMSSETTCLPSA